MTIKRRVSYIAVIFALTLSILLSGCGMKKMCAVEGCEREVDYYGTYCSIHGCSFCGELADEGCNYCSKHRCKYTGRFGQCEQPIIGADSGSTLKYCDDHKNLDLQEFRKAEDVAAEWNLTVAAKSRNSTFAPFSFQGGFYTTDSGYYFEVYDIDYGKYGYIIVLKENGDLKCDGMRYK